MKRRVLVSLLLLGFAIPASAQRQTVQQARSTTGGHDVRDCTDPFAKAHFKLEETSGNAAVDPGCALAGTTLVPVNTFGTPTFTYGLDSPPSLGKGIRISGGDSNKGHFQSAGDVEALDPGTGDLYIDVFMRPDAGGGSDILSKWNGSGYLLLDQGSFRFLIGDGTNTCDVSKPPTGGSFVVGTWYRLRATWVASTRTCTAAIDDLAPASITVGAMGSINNTAKFVIGGRDGGASGRNATWADVRVSVGGPTPASYTVIPDRTQVIGYGTGTCNDPNVVAYFSFDTAGNQTVPSGCTLANQVWTESDADNSITFGHSTLPGLGTAVKFTGNNLARLIGPGIDVDALDLNNSPMVVDFWVKKDVGNYCTVYSKRDNATGKGYEIRVGSNVSEIAYHFGGSATSHCSTGQLAAGQWMNIRSVLTAGGQLTTFKDNVQCGSTGMTYGDQSNAIAPKIGSGNFFGAECEIADFSITVGNATNSTYRTVPIRSPLVIDRTVAQ